MFVSLLSQMKGLLVVDVIMIPPSYFPETVSFSPFRTFP